METEMSRVVKDQLELEFDAVHLSEPAREGPDLSNSVGVQVISLSMHLARKAARRNSESRVPDSDLALIDRIANRVRFF
jgi:hypothetical protein